MKRSKPLPDTHPELTVLESPGYREYRIQNWRLARDGSGRVIAGHTLWSWNDSLVSVLLSVLWLKLRSSTVGITCLAILAVGHLYCKCTQVLYESLIVLSPHGIQLETHWGISSITCFTTRRFIPLVSIKDCVINEGLMRWNVRHYLAVVKQDGLGQLSVAVAFQHILPHFPVLLEVYYGVHELLFIAN